MTGPAPDPLLGTRLDGRYLVARHVADGGMGSVYVAVDERLERPVALKVMRPDLARDAAFVERFRREARSAARLSHPNVVGVYDQGRDGDAVFLVMEYVEGETLREVLRRGALSPAEALRIMRQLLGALGAAHAAGLVHRDVKPENVLLAEDGQVKVADFGLARAVTASTATGADLLGTVAYLAPEQVERGRVDARTDVYAAGLVLYELLTGTQAVTGDTPLQVAYRHVHGEVPAPSEARPDLAPQLDELVAVATHREPTERPADGLAYLELVRAAQQQLTPAQLDLPGPADPEAGAAGQRTDKVVFPTKPVPSAAEEAPAKGATRGQRAPRHGAATRVLAAVLAALILLGGGAGWWMFLGPGSARIVPEVAARSEAEASAALAGADLRTEIVPTFDENVPAGQVISSEPTPGSEVRRGTSVALQVSRGQERYQVPDVTGSSLGDAQREITAAHLAVGPVTEEFSETVGTGQIVSVSPGPGTSQRRDTPVSLVVSKGRQPFEIRDWTGRPYAQAEKALKDVGLVPQVLSEEFSTTVPKGSIIKQTPASGTAYKGTQITFTVSKGPDLVTVPAVTGKSEREATDLLRAAGFAVEVNRIAGGLFGTAHSTDPGAGTSAPRGSTIVLRVV